VDGDGTELLRVEARELRHRSRAVVGLGSASHTYLASLIAVDLLSAGSPHFITLSGAPPPRPDLALGGGVDFAGDMCAAELAKVKGGGSALQKVGAWLAGVGAAAAGAVVSPLSPRGSGAASAELTGSAEEGGAPPALRVWQLRSGADDAAHELSLGLAPGKVLYVPAFWRALDDFWAPLEGAQWSSQLGETARLRLRHGRIYRGIDKLMREGWHSAEIKILTPFLELSDLLGLPSWRHKLTLDISPIEMALERGGEAGRGRIIN
jgi:hypothetical protein